MANNTLEVQQKSQYSVINLGSKDHWDEYPMFVPALNIELRGKVFLKEALGLTGMEISVNKMPPGKSVPFWHSHQQNEELYMFLGGEGEMYIDDECIPIKEGTIFRIKPEAKRIFRNTSNSNDLYCIVIQAKQDSLEQHTVTDGMKDDSPLPWA